MAGFGQVALKKAAMELGRSLLGQYANGNVLLGYALMICSMGMISVAYRGVSLKVAPALDSLGFVIVPMLSWLFLGEKVTLVKGAGFLLIICGVLIFVW